MKCIIPCSGFIIFSQDKTKTVLVETHMGNLSYPKGKRKKGEIYMETALRELEEETGLTEDDIDIIKDVFLDELSNKSNPSVRYFLAYIKDEKYKFIFDSEELMDVEWYDRENILLFNNIKNSRKLILNEALTILT